MRRNEVTDAVTHQRERYAKLSLYAVNVAVLDALFVALAAESGTST